MKTFNKLLRVFALIGYLGLAKGDNAFVTFDPEMEQGSTCTLPPSFKVKIETGSRSLTLDLTRNDHVNPRAPAYIIQTNGNSDTIFQTDKAEAGKHQAAYQEFHHEVALLVTCHLNDQKGAQYEMEGTVFLENLKYRILPSSSRLSPYQRLFHSENVKLYHLMRSKENMPFDAGIDVSLHEEILAKTLEEIRLPNRRVKRETTEATNIYLDVLVLLEYSVMKVWMARTDDGRLKAKEYFAHVMNAVNLRFSHIDNQDFKFIVRLVGFYISETKESSPWSEDDVTMFDGVSRINASLVLSNLREWVQSNQSQLIAHDHLMLFTSYDMIGGDTGYRFNYTTGLAYVETMCNTDGSSVSVVEDHGGFQSVGTATHELGHSLGANHDGENNTCLASDRFMMAPTSYDETNATKYNPWFFSNCSIQAFAGFVEKTLNTDRASCLTGSETPESDMPDIGGQMPGQLYSPDEQCRQQFKNDSYLCRGTNFDSGDLFCRAMFCASSSISVCLLVTAALGTTCGNRKWCNDGRCIESTDAPVASDLCPHGDAPSVTTTDGTVACNVLRSRPENCYTTEWKTQCCDTCSGLCTGPEGCPCGDRTPKENCNEEHCSGYSLENKNICCHTCRNYLTTTASTTSMTSSTASSSERSTTVTTSTTISQSTSTSKSTSSSSSPMTTANSPQTTTIATSVKTTKTAMTSTTEAEVTHPNTCTDVTTFKSKTCGDHIKNFGPKACYTDHVNKSCCDTCSQIANEALPNCPWGDMSPSTCYPLKLYSGNGLCPQNKAIQEACCGTCAELVDAINVKLQTQIKTSSALRVHLEFWLILTMFVHLCFPV